jgi:hypothetical protein
MLKELSIQVLKTKPYRIKVCRSCWDPDQPQLQLGMYPVNDPQAVREPRPDSPSYLVGGTTGLQIDLTGNTTVDGFGYPSGGSRVFQWGWAPVGGSRQDDAGLTPNDLLLNVEIGTVTVAVDAPAPGPTPGAPDIISVGPPFSSSAGGATVYVSGTGMTGLTAVDFGGAAGTSITVLSDATATVVTPAHAPGTVSVSATNAYGTGTWSGTFTYS